MLGCSATERSFQSSTFRSLVCFSTKSSLRCAEAAYRAVRLCREARASWVERGELAWADGLAGSYCASTFCPKAVLFPGPSPARTSFRNAKTSLGVGAIRWTILDWLQTTMRPCAPTRWLCPHFYQSWCVRQSMTSEQNSVVLRTVSMLTPSVAQGAPDKARLAPHRLGLPLGHVAARGSSAIWTLWGERRTRGRVDPELFAAPAADCPSRASEAYRPGQIHPINVHNIPMAGQCTRLCTSRLVYK